MSTGAAPRPTWAQMAALTVALAAMVSAMAAIPAMALLQEDASAQPLRGVFTVTISRTDIP